ncbi:MAG TPA: hypothetical protein VF199_02575 [Bacillales bacterium]
MSVGSQSVALCEDHLETITYCCYRYYCYKIERKDARCERLIDTYNGVYCSEEQVQSCPC